MFVPVVFLTGPAAYLFTPLALAVVFAMLASYFLSRTLVPTMVNYLLPVPRRRLKCAVRKTRRPATAIRSGRCCDIRHVSTRHLTTPSSGCDWPITACWILRLDHRPMALIVLLGFALGSFALYPHIGLDFFPSVDAGQFRMHVRAPTGTRVEETERIFGQVEDVIREIVPEHDREMILDNMGLTQSFTIMAYVDNGTVSDADGEILVSLKPDHRPTADYVARLRRELPRRFPECTFYFEPADITSQILNFGLPAPIDVQVVGVDRVGQSGHRPKAAPRDRTDTRCRRRAPPSNDGQSESASGRRSDHGLAGWTHAAGRDRQRAGVAQFDQPGSRRTIGSTP